MKTLTPIDIQNLAFELNEQLKESQLQEVLFCNRTLFLGFYKQKAVWLVVDLKASCPQIACLNSIEALKIKDQRKPLTLFIKAHMRGHRVNRVQAPAEFGRVLFLEFTQERKIEFRLFPRGQNILVEAAGKNIAYSKPQDLKPMAEIPPPAEFTRILQIRSEEWVAQQSTQNGLKSISEGEAAAPRESRLKKIDKAISSIQADMCSKAEAPWRKLAEWLQLHQSTMVPSEFKNLINTEMNWIKNVERCYKKAKEIERKQQNSQLRIQELIDQKARIERGEVKVPTVSAPQLLAQAEAKGRTIELAPNLTLYLGRSATDNVKLLRAARPWHLWFHLKDYPSAHGFLQCDKNAVVPDRVLHQVAHHLVMSQFRSKPHLAVKKVDVLVTECRYVRAIKGAGPGQVTYTHARTFLFVANKS